MGGSQMKKGLTFLLIILLLLVFQGSAAAEKPYL
jgi:hypothetical protein